MRVKITEFSNRDAARHHDKVGKIGSGNIEKWENGWSFCTKFTFENGDVWPLFEFKYIEVPEPLKPCWKCGKQPFYVNENGFKSFDRYGKNAVSDYVSCVADCMPYSEKYTVDEWQNHPRPEPSAMSELGKWIDENKHANCRCELVEKPEFVKRSLFYKIRDYSNLEAAYNRVVKRHNDLQARCNSAEGMRDNYKETLESWEPLAISKARELELMTKVADNWQQRLICVQKYYADATDQIGLRLKFSVGHNHITITIGNPVTLFENFISNSGKLEWSVSRCSRKDVYDWKQGAIKSLDNYCDEHKGAKKLRRDLRKALAKKYPEVFSESSRV